MINYKYELKKSQIPGAGLGLYLSEEVKKGSIVIFPNQEHKLLKKEDILKFPKTSIEYQSSLRWFEDVYTIDPEWSPESHLNHSFHPNCLWHLGMVFALHNLTKDTELTVDYRFFLGPEDDAGFLDFATGLPIKGFSWPKKMQLSTRLLAQLFEEKTLSNFRQPEL